MEKVIVKGLCGFLFLFVLFFSIFVVLKPINCRAEGNATFFLDPSQVNDTELVPGTFFNVSVEVDNIPASQGLAGIQFTLKYDPNLLSATFLDEVIFHNVTPSSEWNNIWQLASAINNTAGRVSYAYTWQDLYEAVQSGYAPILGNHTVVVIGFEVKGIGNCALAFGVVKLADANAGPIPTDTNDGFFSNSGGGQTGIEVHVTPPQLNQTQNVGSVFDFDVKLDNADNSTGIVRASFMLTWNASLYEALNLTEVMFHEITPQNEWNNIGAVQDEIDNVLGYVVYDYTFLNVDRAISLGYAPIWGNHTLATITFKVKDLGTSILHFEASNATAVAESGGGLTLQAARPMLVVDSVFRNFIRGDLNGDNSVDIYDALKAAHSFGSNAGSTNWNWAADIDGNGVVDIYDIIIIASNFGRHA